MIVTCSLQCQKSSIQDKIVKYEHHADILVEAQQRAENEQHLCYDDVAPQNVQQEEHDALQPVEQSDEFIFYDPNKHGKEQGYDIGVDIGLGPRPDQDDTQVLPGRMPDSEYRNLIRKLNDKQSTILKHVLKHIKTKSDPLFLFLTGGAGVGKSVVVQALFQSLHRFLCAVEGQDPEDCKILITAPTGKAAYNVEGLTLHNAFRIDPNKRHRELSSDALNTLQMKYRNLSVLLIDEISMVGNIC